MRSHPSDSFDVLLAKSLYSQADRTLKDASEIDFNKIKLKLGPEKYTELVEHIGDVLQGNKPNKIANLMGKNLQLEAKTLNEHLVFARSMDQLQDEKLRKHIEYQKLQHMGVAASRCFHTLSMTCTNNQKLQNLYQDIGCTLDIVTNVGMAAGSFMMGDMLGGITATFQAIGSIASYRKAKNDRKNKKPHPMLEAMANMIMQSTKEIIKHIHKSHDVLAKIMIDSIGYVLNEIAEVYQLLGSQIKASEIAVCKEIRELRKELYKISLELSAQNELTHQDNARVEKILFTLFTEDKVQNLKKAIYELNNLTTKYKKENIAEEKHRPHDPYDSKHYDSKHDSKPSYIDPREQLRRSFIKQEGLSKAKDTISNNVRVILNSIQPLGTFTQPSMTGQIHYTLDNKESVADIVSRTALKDLENSDPAITISTHMGLLTLLANQVTSDVWRNEIHASTQINMVRTLGLILEYANVGQITNDPNAYTNPRIMESAMRTLAEVTTIFPQHISYDLDQLDAIIYTHLAQQKLHNDLANDPNLMESLIHLYNQSFQNLLTITGEQINNENKMINQQVTSQFPNATLGQIDLRKKLTDYKTNELKMPGNTPITGGSYTHVVSENTYVRDEGWASTLNWVGTVPHTKIKIFETNEKIHGTAKVPKIFKGTIYKTVTDAGGNTDFQTFLGNVSLPNIYVILHCLKLIEVKLSYSGTRHDNANETWPVNVAIQVPNITVADNIGTITKYIKNNVTQPMCFIPDSNNQAYETRLQNTAYDNFIKAHLANVCNTLLDDKLTNPLHQTYKELDAYRNLILLYLIIKKISPADYQFIASLPSAQYIKRAFFADARITPTSANELTVFALEPRLGPIFTRIKTLYTDDLKNNKSPPVRVKSTLFSNLGSSTSMSFFACKQTLVNKREQYISQKVEAYQKLLAGFEELIIDEFKKLWMPCLAKISAEGKLNRHYIKAIHTFDKLEPMLSILQTKFDPELVITLRETCLTLHRCFKSLSRYLPTGYSLDQNDLDELIENNVTALNVHRQSR